MTARSCVVAGLALAACGPTAHPPTTPPPAAGAVATIPFEDDFHLIFVEVAVGDAAPRWFLLDSGADFSLLDSDAAKELGVALLDAGVSAQPGGEIQVAHAHDVAFRLGAATFVSSDVMVTQLRLLNRFVGRRFDGILGHDFLVRYTVAVNYDDRRIVLYEPATFDHRGKGESLSVELVDNEAFIHATLDTGAKQVDARLKLDTGSIDAIGLNGSFVQSRTLFGRDQPRIERAGVALGGGTVGYDTRLAALRLGAITLRDMVVGYGADTTRGGDAGTIGAEVLRRFTVIFDYARKRLILEPGAHARDPFVRDMSGLLAATDDTFEHLVAVAISPGSPAAEAGLAPGDAITRVDGTAFASIGLRRVFERVRRPGALRLRISRKGAEQDVVLTLRPLLP